MLQTERVMFHDPPVNKEVKVQKDGSIHLARGLAGERVHFVADRTEEGDEIDKQAVAGAADMIQEALEQDDDEVRAKMLRQALAALDQQAE
jgi:folate-dependent phosphoribosylglycinamide formyltransferase PurN